MKRSCGFVMKWSCGFASLAAVLFGLFQPSVVDGASFELPVLEDITTFSTSNSRYDGDHIIASETDTPEGYWGAWLKFDLSSLSGMVVTSGKLEITTHGNFHGPDAINHQIHSSSDDSWDETTLYGLIQPGESTLTPYGSVSIADPGFSDTTYSWDVTAALNGSHGLAGANETLSLFLRPEDVTPAVSRGPHFFSKETAAATVLPPRLIVEAIPIPEPTTVWLLSAGLLSWRGLARRFC